MVNAPSKYVQTPVRVTIPASGEVIVYADSADAAREYIRRTAFDAGVYAIEPVAKRRFKRRQISFTWPGVGHFFAPRR